MRLAVFLIVFQCLFSLALAINCGSQLNSIYRIYEYEYMKNPICELRINMSEIVILVVGHQLKQLKKQPEKKFRLERDSNP